tara:strand:+ start:47 stop:418 length:372 start_codon:yes stop_codon:yes gene_type:complete
MTNDTATAIEIDGFFKDTRNGRVFQTRESNLWAWGDVESGSRIDPEDDDTGEKLGEPFTVAAIGSPFFIGKKKFVYLYLAEPKKSPERIAIPREYNEDVDGSMGHLESAHLRDLGRSGELPGA